LPAAQNASLREQAIESIGTYEWQDWTMPGSPLVNTNGHYWSRLAELAWNRDIERRISESMGVVPVREPLSSRSGAPSRVPGRPCRAVFGPRSAR
jgi:hypothetical protein